MYERFISERYSHRASSRISPRQIIPTKKQSNWASTMSTNFFYYRCPCPSTDCNGAICRYQDIVAAPVPSQYSSPSCAHFTQDRKHLSYQTTTKDISSAAGKYESMSSPMTITRDNFRWTPYPSQSRLTQESSTPPKTATERRKLQISF